MNKICDCLTSGNGVLFRTRAPTGLTPGRRSLQSQTSMSHKTPQAPKTAGFKPGTEQIVHGVCHECPRYEEVYTADTAASAKAQAVIDAIEHARLSGHNNIETQLLTEPGVPNCSRCKKPVHVTIGEGPSPADERNQPCGCPTEVLD
jgi:hypothetical protein